MMRLRQIEAVRWTVLAVCDDRGACPVREFLDQLAIDSEPDYDQIVAVLQRAAAVGPPRSNMKSRPLAAKLFEFKSRGGIRIPYFYDEGYVIICTEAMRKPKKAELRRVIMHSETIRTRYFEAKRHAAIEIVREDT
jgi:hypothetical protein